MSVDDAVSGIQALTAAIMSYMAEVGVDPSLIQLALEYEAGDMRYLSRSEMERYRVTNLEAAATESKVDPPRRSSLSIPDAVSGSIRHPSGVVAIKAGPNDRSADVATLRNGTRLKIAESVDRWYRVSASGVDGFAHHTWVYVDQYESGPFSGRHIQIKSFTSYDRAEAFVRRSPLPLSAYLASNGWFAITFGETYAVAEATQILQRLKAAEAIPQDSFMTYGNTYVRKVCCE